MILLDPKKDLPQREQKVLQHYPFPTPPYGGTRVTAYFTLEGDAYAIKIENEAITGNYSTFNTNKQPEFRASRFVCTKEFIERSESRASIPELDTIIASDPAQDPEMFFIGDPESGVNYLHKKEMQLVRLLGKKEEEVKKFAEEHKITISYRKPFK